MSAVVCKLVLVEDTMGFSLVTYESGHPRTTTASSATAPVERRRGELGKFLKARRARLSPEDFGMPAGSRRRTPGLRREEVALLAGVGVTWYTWLEQGRPINASVQVLDAVARTLRLDRAEREHLYRLAEAAPVRAGRSHTAVPDELGAIVDSLTPLPAVAMNTRFDVLSSNDAHKRLFRDWHSMPCIHMNLLWCAITEPDSRAKFLNYDDEIRYLVARLRSSYGRYIGDPEWEEDITRLSRLSPDFCELWARHEVAEPQRRAPVFLHPQVGRLAFTSTEFAAPATPELRLLVYTPQDEPSRQAMDQLIRDPACAPST
jgi:transcriptional regulator with XRE-family HTH domain